LPTNTIARAVTSTTKDLIALLLLRHTFGTGL
jgi:hypothetical protein